MKRFLLFLFVCLLSTAAVFAMSGEISYIEGAVSISRGISHIDAAIGDALGDGDTIFTASDGLAEVSLESGSTVTINSGSSFRMDQTSDSESASGKKSFFRVLLGAVSFKFRNLSNEPDVGTPLSICSVRGTAFTVYTALDGASLTVVSDGLVEVSSGGSTALLEAGEGVEAIVGLGLGKPFEAKSGFVRYEEFADEALARMDADPVGTLRELTALMLDYAEEGAFYLRSWETNADEMDKVVDSLVALREESGEDAFRKGREANLRPLQTRGVELDSTYRYHLLSGLLLRRYMLSNLYIRVRSRYLSEPKTSEWIDFIDAYKETLNNYEKKLIPMLEDEDL